MDNQLLFNHRPETRLFIVLGIALALLLLVSLIFGLDTRRGDESVPTEAAQEAFPKVSIGAKAAYVYDIRTKAVLYAKNEDVRLPLASLTKIMSALVAEALSPAYGTVRVGEEALLVEGDSGLYRDELWSLKNILDFSLLTSSNDGMRAIALSLGALSKASASSEEIVADFVREMNKKARELGLENTYFWNETGLDQSDVLSGAYGTAEDISVLIEHILTNNPELLAATREAQNTFYSLNNHPHMARNTNNLVSEIPGLLASKTGFTDTAGGNLVVVFDPELGRPIVISILGSTEQGRFSDMRALVTAVMEYISK